MTIVSGRKEAPKQGACYDLEAGQSFAAGDGPCADGGDLVIPASPNTKDLVEGYLKGAKLTITVDEEGRKTIKVKGFDAPDQMVFINPQPPEEKAEQQVAKNDPPKRKARRKTATPQEKKEIALPRRIDGPNVGQLAIDIEISASTLLNNGDAVALHAPAPKQEDSFVQPRNGDLKRLMDEIALSSSRMQCGESGCVCEYPPCIPCSMESMEISGKSRDQWAAFWILWFSTQGTFSERMMAIRSLSEGEKDALQAAKYRWGFSKEIRSDIGRFDWENGRIPGEHLKRMAAAEDLREKGTKVVSGSKASSEDLKAVIEIVADVGGPAPARIHAIKWLESHDAIGHPGVKKLLKDIIAADPDDSVRAVAMDVLDGVRGRRAAGQLSKTP